MGIGLGTTVTTIEHRRSVMIRIQNFDVPGGGKRRMYENRVSVGVGRSGDSSNTDKASNQLVQFFLRTFFKKHPDLLPTIPGKGREFLLDGQPGRQTVEGINRFQAFATRIGIPLINDSRVSVATGVNVPNSGKRWTIHALNSFFISIAGQKEFDNLFLNKEIEAEAKLLHNELVLEEQRVRVGG
jgi:hypothetical protein